MGLVLTTVTGLVIWIVLWAIGVKGFDAFMITVALVVTGATLRLVAQYLPGAREWTRRRLRAPS